MVAAPAAVDAVARAKAMPRLAVGLHLVLVEGRPALPPERVPHLVRPDGQFRTDMARMGFELATRPRARRELAAEIEAQFAAFAATGLRLDHVNAHKHFHVHPVIAGLVLAIGRRYGMVALRVPREPRGVVIETDALGRHGRAWPGHPRLPSDTTTANSWMPGPRPGMTEPGRGHVPSHAILSAPWAAWLAIRARRAGILVPDAVIGLAWSGAFTAERLAAALGRLPGGLVEIYLHPATADCFPGSAPGYRYRDELAALADPAVRAALVAAGQHASGFAEQVAAGGNDRPGVALMPQNPAK